MKDGDGLNDILGYARLVEGNQHSEHLSKLYLETVKSTKTVEAVDKKEWKKKTKSLVVPSEDKILSTGLSQKDKK